MRSEVERRGHEFRGGLPIRLADGQEWAFPGPRELLGASDQPDPELVDLLRGVAESEDESERLRGELALAIHLLALNYDLEPADYARLLGGPGLAPMQRGFRDLATRLALALAERARPRSAPESGRRFRLPAFRPRRDRGLVWRADRAAS